MTKLELVNAALQPYTHLNINNAILYDQLSTNHGLLNINSIFILFRGSSKITCLEMSKTTSIPFIYSEMPCL